MSKNIFVAGHNGMVGSAIVRKLQNDPANNLIVANRNELDLLNQHQVNKFFSAHQIDEVYLAAAKVGGIHANNTYPAQFIYENLAIQTNVIHAAHLNDVQKLLFLGSSCIYPKFAEQPIKEEYLLTGELEPTNEPYAIAKIAGIKMCESYNRQYGRDYRSVMPTNLYGPGDNFHPENSHVVPALIRRFHEATKFGYDEVVVWGSGSAKREFLHVDDMADACIFLMAKSQKQFKKLSLGLHINVGSSCEISIKTLAETIKLVTGFTGKICWNANKPDGTMRKFLYSGKMHSLGWRSKIDLSIGLALTYQWFCGK